LDTGTVYADGAALGARWQFDFGAFTRRATLELLQCMAQALLVFRMYRIRAKFRSDAAAKEDCMSFANTGAIGPTLASHRFDMAPSANSPACFSWSIEKLRFAALVLVATALPAAILALTPSVAAVRVLGLAWLFAIARLARGISRRASFGTAVLMIDHSGILDSRLMPRRIGWHEIEMVFPVNLDRGRVIDLSLRWPDTTLAGTRWLTRIGAVLQQAYGVPAITISMLLLDGQVADLLAAIARYRPDLLPPATLRRATAR
jgi:hypothetical protein